MGLTLSEEGTVATSGGGGNYYCGRSAVCGGHEMRRGRHCATFTLRSLDGGAAILGVVGVGFDPTSSGRAYASSEGWLLSTFHGHLLHAGRASEWEGRPGQLKEGDALVRLPPSTPCSLCRLWLMRCVCRRACCSTSTRPP